MVPSEVLNDAEALVTRRSDKAIDSFVIFSAVCNYMMCRLLLWHRQQELRNQMMIQPAKRGVITMLLPKQN